VPVPPVVAVALHPVGCPVVVVAVADPAKAVHVTIVAADVEANADVAGRATTNPAGIATDAASAANTRRM